MKQTKTVTRYLAVFMMVGIMLGAGIHLATASKDPTTVRMVPENFSKLAQEVRPGVVNIRTVRTMKDGGPVFRHFFENPFGNQNPHENFPNPFSGRNPSKDFKQQSLGSGFILDREGYIVTNNHVIENADQIKVRLTNEKEYDAKVVGRDPKTDLALIKIEPSDKLVPLKMGNSDSLQVGTWVVAIGSPFGLEQTVTAGIVSAKGRTIGAGPYDDFIQTDASINPGNSGGPLLNMNGEVVGINTAIVASGQGIGFAIPVNLARGIVDQLIKDGEVTRAWLGVAIQDVTPELAEYYSVKDQKGVFVTEVYKGEPADKGGIKPSDIIIAVNGKTVSSTRGLSRTIASSPIGKEIPIAVVRDGKEKAVQVELSKRMDSKLMAKQKLESTDEFGLKLSELKPDTARNLGFPKNEKGVLVTHVEPGSKGALAGIHRGDLVKEVNRTSIDTMEEYRKQMTKVKSGEPVRLLLKRPNAGFIAVKIV